MKLGGNRIRTSSGKVMRFASKSKMQNWEKMAKAIKHGFKPSRGRKG